MASSDGGGYMGKHGNGLPGPQNITEISNVIEVPESYHYDIG